MANRKKAIFRNEVKTIGHLRKPDGSFTKSWGEILNTLMDSFFPQSTHLREIDCPTRVMVMRANLLNIVTSRKVEAAFKSFKGPKLFSFQNRGKTTTMIPEHSGRSRLSSFILKGQERAVAWHLEELGIVNKLSSRQHTFRSVRGRECD